jgi:hypothetical protein
MNLGQGQKSPAVPWPVLKCGKGGQPAFPQRKVKPACPFSGTSLHFNQVVQSFITFTTRRIIYKFSDILKTSPPSPGKRCTSSRTEEIGYNRIPAFPYRLKQKSLPSSSTLADAVGNGGDFLIAGHGCPDMMKITLAIQLLQKRFQRAGFIQQQYHLRIWIPFIRGLYAKKALRRKGEGLTTKQPGIP